MCVRGFLRAVIPVASDALHAGLLWVRVVAKWTSQWGSSVSRDAREALGSVAADCGTKSWARFYNLEKLSIFLHVHIASCYCISDRYHIFFAFVPAFCLIMAEAQSFSGLSSGH